MGTYSTYKTDKKLENEGAWVTLADGSEWKIRRGTSNASQTALRNAQKPHQTLIRQCEMRGDPLPEAIQDEININWVANGLVTDWKGVTDENEEPLNYATEACKKVLGDLPDVMMEILLASGRSAQYRAASLSDAEKN